MKTIIIAGGSGFLGQVLESYFSKKEYEIKILTRNPKQDNEVFWNAKDLGKWAKHLEHADVLINLTGKSVDCRYNEKNKKLIYSSRIDSTNALGLAINLCENPPKIWINSSTATIYRHSLGKEMDEESGEIGNDFSMNIAKSWEEAFNTIKNPKTRKIIIRTAIVLGKKGGAFIPLKKLTKFGLGGKQASGNQKVSWIHEEDFARAIHFLIDSENDRLTEFFSTEFYGTTIGPKVNTEIDTMGSFRNSKIKITINTRLSLVIDKVPLITLIAADASSRTFLIKKAGLFCM